MRKYRKFKKRFFRRGKKRRSKKRRNYFVSRGGVRL